MGDEAGDGKNANTKYIGDETKGCESIWQVEWRVTTEIARNIDGLDESNLFCNVGKISRFHLPIRSEVVDV